MLLICLFSFMLYSNQEKLKVELMKKKRLLLLILLVFTLIPAFAAIDYGIYEGNKLQLITAPMVVRDDCPDNRNHTSAVATLPVGTEITVKHLNNDWTYIEDPNGVDCFVISNTELAKELGLNPEDYHPEYGGGSTGGDGGGSSGDPSDYIIAEPEDIISKLNN